MRRLGMDRAGQVLVRRRGIVLGVCVAITVAAAALAATGLTFSGNVADILRTQSAGSVKLGEIEARFHPFTTDEIIVVSAPDLGRTDTYDALEAFVSELQLIEGVAAVISIFTMPDAGRSSQTFLASREARGLPPAERLDRLRQSQPLASQILAADRTTTIVTLMAAQPDEGPARPLPDAARAEIASIAEAHAPALSVQLAGVGEVHRSIERALVRDQRALTALSTLLSIGLSLIVFRSWRVAVICGTPPVVGALWFLGFAAVSGIRIDTVTTIIPTLLIVVGFADSVHLYYARARARERGLDDEQAVRAAMAETAPACLLTSLTTALACIGIGLTGSATLNGFAVGGFFGMLIVFAAVILLMPVLTLALDRAGRTGASGGALRFAGLGQVAIGLLRFRRTVVAGSVGLLVVLAVAQFQVPTGYSMAGHLPDDLPLRQTERLLSDKGLGSGQLFLIVDDADGERGLGDADLQRLADAARAALPEIAAAGSGRVFPTPARLARLADEGHPLLGRYVADDGLAYLLPVPVNLTADAGTIAGDAAAIRARLAETGLGEHSVLAGLALLSAEEVPRMIVDLRTGFYMALVLIAGVMMYATGSVRLGLLSLIPNLIPVLGVEAWLWLSGQELSLTGAVALTIAFGIAVDDSIHVINRYQNAAAADDADPVRTAIGDTVSPMTASTILLAIGLGVTQASSLPSVAIFGQMVVAALILALFADLFVLPAFLGRTKDRRVER